MHYKKNCSRSLAVNMMGYILADSMLLGKQRGKNARKSVTGFLIPSHDEQDKFLNSIINLGTIIFDREF